MFTGGFILDKKENIDINKTNNKNDIKKNNSKFFVYLELVNTFLVVVSLCISAYAIYNSNKLLIYQVEQDRLPRVVCLDQSMTTSLKRDSYGDIKNFDSIDNMMLKIHNVGAGVAQNCEMIWDTESVKAACIKAKELLKHSVSIHKFEYDNISNQLLYLYDYSFESKNDELKAIWYHDDELGEYRINNFEIPSNQKSYILPIDKENNDTYIKIPDELAALLLELGNQEITDPVSLQLVFYYQDMLGKKYQEIFIITFEFEHITEKNASVYCTYNVNAKNK